MSRCYRIRVSESATRLVHVGDAVAADLELLPILPAARLHELLAAELVARGFARSGAVASREEGDGVVVSVDLGTGRVSVRASASEEVVAAGRQETAVERTADTGKAEARVRGQLRARLERDLDRRAAEVQAETTRRLEGRLGDLRAEMDAVVTRVTVAALEERAAQLGEIEEIQRDPATGDVTIKVRL